MDVTRLKIGYVPNDESLRLPGDRRRFVYYARKRGIKFEIADPRKTYDVVIATHAGTDLSQWVNYAKGKLIFDIVDSYFAIARNDVKGRLRGLAKFVSRQSKFLQLDYTQAMANICRRADAVVCATDTQKKDILSFCSNTHVILDYSFFFVRERKNNYQLANPGHIHLVWEGFAENIRFFSDIAAALEPLKPRHTTHLHIISSLHYYQYMRRFGRKNTESTIVGTLGGVVNHVYLYQWNEFTLPKIATACDMAIIPTDTHIPVENLRPANKLLFFWYLGIPTLVSATPEYQRVMAEAGVQHMTCNSLEDWSQNLEYNLAHTAARKESANRGYDYVTQHFTEETWISRWDQVLASVMSGEN
jgi:glycosyltransferase involved in cell wall biosynthesis